MGASLVIGVDGDETVNGGKERMRRRMELVRTGRIDLTPLLTHSFALDDIGDALFGERRDGVIKVALRP